MFGVYINYIAVVVAAVVSYLFGWLWHSPALFGKYWMKLEGIDMPSAVTPEVKKQMKKSMSLGLIAQFIFAWGLAYVLGASGIVFNLGGGLTMAVIIWLAFVVTTLAGGWLWERKSGKLFAFNVIFPLISIAIMTLILALW